MNNGWIGPSGQIGPQLGDCLVAIRRVLVHQLPDDRGERGRNSPGNPFQRFGVIHPLLEDLVDDVATLERRMTGEGEIDCAAETIKVAPLIGPRGVAKLFGAGVIEGPDHDVMARQWKPSSSPIRRASPRSRIRASPSGVTIKLEGLISRVDQTDGVCGFEAVDDLEKVAGGIGHAERATLGVLDEVIKALTRDILEDHEVYVCRPDPRRASARG